MLNDLITIKDAEFFQAVYKKGLILMSKALAKEKILVTLPKSNHPLSYFEILSVLAIAPSKRKKAINFYIQTKTSLHLQTVGVLAWVIRNCISEFDEKEKISFEKLFTTYEAAFDKKIDEKGLFVTEEETDFTGRNRGGILIENQALYLKILDILYFLTNDDMYLFKQRRLVRSVRETMDGAYVLDRADSLEMTTSPFFAAFFAPELFEKDDWGKTFDLLLKPENLWVFWGGLRVLGQADQNYHAEKDGESWFFINNLAAMVLFRLNLDKYRDFIDKIILASSKNINWQEHVGRPCELVMTYNNKIVVKELNSVTLATYIYLYRLIAK